MQFGDILASPFFWILNVICIVVCSYAKRNVVAGMITGLIAPMIIIPIWFIATLALNVPHLLVRTLFPDLFPSLQYTDLAWSHAILFLTTPSHIAALLTAIAFGWYCELERRTAHLPVATFNKGTEGRCSNMLRRPTWR